MKGCETANALASLTRGSILVCHERRKEEKLTDRQKTIYRHCWTITDTQLFSKYLDVQSSVVKRKADCTFSKSAFLFLLIPPINIVSQTRRGQRHNERREILSMETVKLRAINVSLHRAS